MFPILIYNNNITENEEQREMMEFYENRTSDVEYGDQLYGGDKDSICGREGCEGCFQNETHSIFHKYTRDMHYEQLEELSGMTDGRVINYSERTDVVSILQGVVDDILTQDVIEVGNEIDHPFKQKFHERREVNFEKESILLDVYLELEPEETYEFDESFGFSPTINDVVADEDEGLVIEVAYNDEIDDMKLGNNSLDLSLKEDMSERVYKYDAIVDNNVSLDGNNIVSYKKDGVWKNITEISTWSNTEVFKETGKYTWEVPDGVDNVEVLIVGGGGGAAGTHGGSNIGGDGGSGIVLIRYEGKIDEFDFESSY